MKLNFGAIPDPEDYSPVPEGEYLCKLIAIEQGRARSNDEMWTLKWVILNGPHEARYPLDRLIFNETSLPRVKLLCSALGFDVSGEGDLTPALLIQKTCVVRVEIDQYDDREGKKRTGNRVPFNGYLASTPSPPPQPGASDDAAEDDLPF